MSNAMLNEHGAVSAKKCGRQLRRNAFFARQNPYFLLAVSFSSFREASRAVTGAPLPPSCLVTLFFELARC